MYIIPFAFWNQGSGFHGYTPLIPNMTSNTTPYGVASSYSGINPAWYAFDGNNGTASEVQFTSPGYTFINYQLPTAKTISKYDILVNSPYSPPLDISLLGSNDGVSYFPIDARSNIPLNTLNTYIIGTTPSYLYYEMVFNNVASIDVLIYTFQIYHYS